MYVVRNKEGIIVGYHTSEEVVFEYTLKYNKYSQKDEAEYQYIKDKKFYKYLKHHKNDDRKYLLRYNNTYVPEMYIGSEHLCENGFIQEVKLSKDTIDTLMTCYDNLDDKQMKQLIKAYKILDSIIKECEDYTPDINQLNHNKMHVSELYDSEYLFKYDI